MKKKSTILPCILTVYLGVMAYIGYPAYAAGTYSGLYYFGVIGATLLVIVLLHFNLKRREKLRSRRNQD